MEVREQEKYWIKVNTIFPYGLNDRIDFEGIRDAYIHVLTNSLKPIYGLLSTVKDNRGKRGLGINRRRNHERWNADEFLHSLFNIDGFPVCKMIKSCIMSPTNAQALEGLTMVSYHLSNVSMIVDGCNEFKLYVMKDISVHKLSRSHVKEKNSGKNFIIIDYVNGIIDDINMKVIINKTEIKNLFPHNSDFRTPSLSYSYSQTTRSRITNEDLRMITR